SAIKIANQAKVKNASGALVEAPGLKEDTLVDDPNLDLFVGRLSQVPTPPKPTDEIKVYLNTKDLDDLWAAVTWSG
ncbi:MAG TPA: hypothetical protein VEW26_00810, partial [Allosphingosinicella sp.]|nr:hypothetical protein [Allosphingosinicella sp.]